MAVEPTLKMSRMKEVLLIMATGQHNIPITVPQSRFTGQTHDVYVAFSLVI